MVHAHAFIDVCYVHVYMYRYAYMYVNVGLYYMYVHGLYAYPCYAYCIATPALTEAFISACTEHELSWLNRVCYC